MAIDDISFFKNDKELKIGKKHIGISDKKIKFNFRVACVIENNESFLMHKQKTDTFWNLLGGRLKYGETCEEALKREIKEEIGCDCKVIRLIKVCENFFEFKGTKFHEMLVIFKVQLLDEIKKDNTENKIEIKWFSMNDMKRISIKPEFVKNIIFDEENDGSWLVNDEIRK